MPDGSTAPIQTRAEDDERDVYRKRREDEVLPARDIGWEAAASKQFRKQNCEDEGCA